MDYGDNEYNFTNASFPWETYKGSFNNLSNPGFKKGRAILLEDMYLDDTFFSPSLGKIIDMNLYIYIYIYNLDKYNFVCKLKYYI